MRFIRYWCLFVAAWCCASAAADELSEPLSAWSTADLILVDSNGPYAARLSKPSPTFGNQQLAGRRVTQPAETETPRPELLPAPRLRPEISPHEEPADEMPLESDESVTEFEDDLMRDELSEFDDPAYPAWGTPFFRGFYVRGEYLSWATSGLNLPPLLTTAPVGTPRAGAGALDRGTTTTLFGGNDVNESMRSGGRITIGMWLDSYCRLGLEGDYFAIADEHTNFTGTSTGNPILTRPFFNMLTGQESGELVAFPNVVSGTVEVNTLTRFQGAGGRLRYALCYASGCGPSWCNPCDGVLRGYRLNLLAGYRFLRLDDRVSIGENLTSTDPQNPGAFLINDSFATQNQFHGGDIGVLLECRRGRWTLDLLSKIALGNNHSQVSIDGSTGITEGGVTTNFSGGLLAQRTNIGTYTNDRFAVVPELGLTLGYNLSPCLRAVVGYTFIYWSQVARAGDQISLDLNPNLIPPEANPFTGPLRPQFAYHFTDFWAQGLNVGLEGRF